MNCELWEDAAGGFLHNQCATHGYQTFDTLLLTTKRQKRNNYF